MGTRRYRFRFEIADDVPGRFAELVASAAPEGLVLLSGGHTITELVGPLATRLAGTHVVVGQVDERLVPVDSSEANRTALIAGLGAVVHGLWVLDLLHEDERTALSDPQAPEPLALARRLAHRYEDVLRSHAPISLVHLGLGSDGHTASLFPHSDGLAVTDAWVCANVDPSGRNPHPRVTVTFPAIRAAARRVVVTTGETKAGIVAKALLGEGLPIHRLPSDQTLFLLDPPAAQFLG